MEAPKRTDWKQAAAAAGESDRWWQTVKRWPKIRGEPKLAWRYLYLRSNGGNEQVAVKAVDLGADQNTSDDAGNRYLATLAREGLIDVKDLGGGVKLVTLFDPLDVAKARRACGGDSQALFAFLEEVEAAGNECPPAVVGFAPAAVPPSEPRRPTDLSAEMATAVPPSEPRSHRGSTLGTAVPAAPLQGKGVSHTPSLTKDKDKVLVLGLSETKTKTMSLSPRNRGGDRGTAVGAATVVGEVLGSIDLAAAGQAYEQALERTKARIREAVRDAAAEPVVIALAHAYADSRVKGPHLDSVLSRIASGRDAGGLPIGNRGGFFRRQVLFKFRDLGIAPEDYGLSPLPLPPPRKPR